MVVTFFTTQLFSGWSQYIGHALFSKQIFKNKNTQFQFKFLFQLF